MHVFCLVKLSSMFYQEVNSDNWKPMNQQYLKYKNDVNIIPTEAAIMLSSAEGNVPRSRKSGVSFLEIHQLHTQKHDTSWWVLYLGHEILYQLPLPTFLYIYIYLQLPVSEIFSWLTIKAYASFVIQLVLIVLFIKCSKLYWLLTKPTAHLGWSFF